MKRNIWRMISFILMAVPCAAVLFSTALQAQSVAVSPSGTATIAVNQSFQYTANVTGLSNTAVIWSVGRVAGGNATVGTIDATGLYTAPATLPAQDPVTIVATSV